MPFQQQVVTLLRYKCLQQVWKQYQSVQLKYNKQEFCINRSKYTVLEVDLLYTNVKGSPFKMYLRVKVKRKHHLLIYTMT